MYITIDIGASNTRIAIFGKNTPESLIFQENFQTLETYDKQLAQAIQYIDTLIQRAKTENKVFTDLKGIGIACTGFIDYASKRIKYTPQTINLNNWIENDLVADLKGKYNVDVELANDTLTAGIGEAVFEQKMLSEKDIGFPGSHKIFSKLVYVIIGTGSAAVVCELRTDKKTKEKKLHAKVVESGNQQIFCDSFEKSDTDNSNRNSNNIKNNLNPDLNHIEDFIAGKNFEKKYGLPPQELPNASDEIKQKYLKFLNFYITNLRILTNPDLIAFGGGLIANQSWLIDDLKKIFEEPKHEFINKCDLRVSKYGTNPGIIGALALIDNNDKIVMENFL